MVTIARKIGSWDNHTMEKDDLASNPNVKEVRTERGSWWQRDLCSEQGRVVVYRRRGPRVWLYRWKEGIGKHRKWRVLDDREVLTEGNIICVYEGRSIESRWRIRGRVKSGFLVSRSVTD